MIPVFSKNSTFFIFLSIIIVYIIGMFVDIMDIDASQYASISREMLETKSFLILKNRGQNYLDKPPLLFWLCSISFQIFGFHNWSYKLPSVLFAILAIYAVYRFAKLYYSHTTSVLATIILGTTQAFFLITNDCRTDTILAGSVMFAIWNIAAYIKEKKSLNFIAGFVGIGLAMLAKGPIGLVVPVLAFGTDFLAKRDFKNIFRWEWLLGIVIILIVLSPMCIGLYQQYGMEGIKFYFWTQSFGRITGESQWRSEGGFFFMFHSFLWSFLPWSLFFLVALGYKLSSFVKSKFKIAANQEFIALGGSLLSYCALSLSKYQLPHYIYVFFPLVAVTTAVYISYVLQEKPKSLVNRSTLSFQLLVILVLWILCGLLMFVVFKSSVFQITLFAALLFPLSYIFFERNFWHRKILYASVFTAIGVNFFLGGFVYPNLLCYQPTRKIADFINYYKIDQNHFFTYKVYQSHSLDFYSNGRVKEIKDSINLGELKVNEFFYIYTNSNGLNSLKNNGFSFAKLLAFDNYSVTKLTLKFLNPSTRATTTEKRFLVKAKKRKL